MSRGDKQAVNAVHQLLMEYLPNAFPKNYGQIVPLKTGIYVELVQRLPEVNPTLLQHARQPHPPHRLPAGLTPSSWGLAL